MTDIEKLIKKHFDLIDWTKKPEEIFNMIYKAENMNPALLSISNNIIEAVKARKEKSDKKIEDNGGKEYTFDFEYQDVSKLDDNEFDTNYGKNFLLSKFEGTSSLYWINSDNTVEMLEEKKDEAIRQLSSKDILLDVLWPEYMKQKAAALKYLNSLTPVTVPATLTKWPWGKRDQLLTKLQQYMSSWFLEHFTSKSSILKYKAVECKNDSGEVMGYDITEFTEILPNMTKDNFVSLFFNNLSYLIGRFAKKSNELPLPYTNEKDKFAFFKMDIEKFIHEGDCPTWDLALKERLSSPEECEVFMAAAWQVYNPKNVSRQAIYILDPHGRSGKSTLLKELFSLLHPSMFALNKDSLKGPFGFAKVWNKQLVTIGDNKNTLLFKSQIMHTMTGGDYADVEYKNKNSFTAPFKGHLWVTGNIVPSIDTDAEHEVSRVVIFNFNKPESAKSILYQLDKKGEIITTKDGSKVLGVGDNVWPKKLREELPCFLYKCKKAYAKYCPYDTELLLPISMQDRIQEECAELNKIVFDEFIENCINIDPDSEILDLDFRNIWTTWKEANIEKYEIQKSEMSFSNLSEHLSKLGIKCKRKTLAEGKRARVWEGIRKKMSDQDNNYLKAMQATAKKLESEVDNDVNNDVDWGFNDTNKTA
jgi:phage/plasmid-associated DNA primase